MTVDLSWVRGLTLEGHPEFGAKLHKTLSDMAADTHVITQQGNFSPNGYPTAPPRPDSLTVVPHPQGVQFAIEHNADFYQGATYEIDATANGVTHTYDVGTSRNGILPVGALTGSYQVRTRYPSGASSTPVVCPGVVQGGTGSARLLPSQGAGTTRGGQPPGFGAAYRGSKPPTRTP